MRTRMMMFGIGAGLLLNCGLWAKTAYEVYSDLGVQGVTHTSIPLKVPNPFPIDKGPNKGGVISYGAEKEGIDTSVRNHKIIHVATPKAQKFKGFVKKLDSIGRMKQRKKFLIKFLNAIYNGDEGISEVSDINGTIHRVNYGRFRGTDFSRSSAHDLYNMFKVWLSETDDHPFNFIKPGLRKKIFTGEFFEVKNPKILTEGLEGSYKNWIPLFGEAERYIAAITPRESGMLAISALAHSGWEINFKPTKSYGDHEAMISWFMSAIREKKELKVPLMKDCDDEDDLEGEEEYYVAGDLEALSAAPGHQRVVWPETVFSSEQEKELYYSHIGEMFKNVQAYIVLKMMALGSGIETGMWKQVHYDEQLGTLDTWKGVIRLEKARFNEGALGVEIRTGMRDVLLQRFIEKVITSRVATNDWSGMKKWQEWSLIPENLFGDMTYKDFYQTKRILPYHLISSEFLKKLANRFDISPEEMKQFLETVTKENSNKSARRMTNEYIVPLWQWENAPFLSIEKKRYLKVLTRDLIRYVNSRGNGIRTDEIIEALRSWVRHTNIQRDIEFYLVPKKSIDLKKDPACFMDNCSLPVNQIDMGIEFTAQYPIKRVANFTHASPVRWLETLLDLDPIERDHLFEQTASTLAKHLYKMPLDAPLPAGSIKGESLLQDFEKKKAEQSGSKNHGHGISILYKIYTTPYNSQLGGKEPASWKVEWDGVGRSYHKNGEVVEGSARGGHIEMVTPKKVVTIEDIKMAFDTFRANSLIPSHHNGGGHVNIDLKPFVGKPHELARFMAIFHQYQNTIAMLFQHPIRLKAAMPFQVTPRLQNQLANFSGSEEDLKRLLYNEGYFNKHVGRKTRYLQLNITAYYQDILPTYLFTPDIDIKNHTIKWHPQFKQKYTLRKMEFRLMNAPENEIESALQIKLVRAMLYKALYNKDPVRGLQEVNFDTYYGEEGAKKAMSDLATMTSDLSLSFDEYKGIMADSLSRFEVYRRSVHYKSLAERMSKHFFFEDWGDAENHPIIDDSDKGPIDEHAKNELEKRLNHPLVLKYQEGEMLGLENADTQRYMIAQRKEKSKKFVGDPLPYFSRQTSIIPNHHLKLGLQNPEFYKE